MRPLLQKLGTDNDVIITVINTNVIVERGNLLVNDLEPRTRLLNRTDDTDVDRD